MILKPQDVVVALKLVALGQESWSYQRLSAELHMSASEINAAVKRGRRARLLAASSEQAAHPRPVIMALQEFLVHGIKFAFPPDRGELTLGVPTSYAGPPLAGGDKPNEDLPPVWPHPRGPVRGYAFSPLYKSVPDAAMDDSGLYELLVLVDAMRDERSRNQNRAARELSTRLSQG